MPFIVNVLTNITSVWLAVCPCMFLHLIYILYACLQKHGLIQKWVKKWEIPLRVSAGGGNFLKGLWNSYSKMRVAVFSHGKDVWFHKKHCGGKLHLQSPDNYQSRKPISILSAGLFQHSAFGLLLPRKRHQLWDFPDFVKFGALRCWRENPSFTFERKEVASQLFGVVWSWVSG